jgi:septal ring factor EnvC (AmiA/AmiB activator)
MEQRLAQLELRTTRIEGKLDTIGVRIDANSEQRERMERTLNKIEIHLRELNGRTRKSEDHIAELRHGHSNMFHELARALQAQPDGSVQLVMPQRPTLSRGQKAGLAAMAAPMVLGAMELLRQAFELAAALAKK